MLTCDAELTASAPAADSTANISADCAAPEPEHRQQVARSLVPLVVDVGIPVGSYYLLHSGLGLSLWLSLALSSVVPAVRSVTGLVAQRELNVLALLMLFVNVAGIAVSFATGDPRLMIAKDSMISSVIAVAILVSVAARRPLMTAGLKPFLTRGTSGRTAAWDRLAAGSARFRRLEGLYSAIWGVALLADCVARLIGAFTLPVSTMVWLGTALTGAAIGIAITAGGVAAAPMQKLIEAETDTEAEAETRSEAGARAGAGAGLAGR
jgi:hypothetical protein